jgi:hypothetical protein
MSIELDAIAFIRHLAADFNPGREPDETVDYCGNEDDAFSQGYDRSEWETKRDAHNFLVEHGLIDK